MKKKCQKCKKEERKPAAQPKRRCSEPGCAELVAAGVKYCAPHVRADPARDRGAYHRANNYFYSSARWRRFRMWFLRKFPLCSVVDCTAPATDVDHVKAIADGGAQFASENCQSLCHSCHSKKTQSELRGSGSRRAGGKGGVKTCGGARVLPHVKLKKYVRKFPARGVTESASFGAGVSGSAQNASKMTVMTDGSDSLGGVGGDEL